MTTDKRETIVVIGAGILGISSAVTLLNSLPSKRILLVSSFFSTDGINPSYPSTLAGAHYRPIPPTTPQLKREARLAQTTYDRFKELASGHPELGIQFMEGVEYVSGEATEAYSALLPGFADQQGFRVLSGDEKPAGVEFAARYDTYTVDPEVYLVHMLRRFKLGGGEVKRMELQSPEEAFELADNVSTVVNCSGTGFGDPKSFIIRGQTCLVSNPCDRTITQQFADGTWSFVIPRPLGGGTIVGGTKQANNWDPKPSQQVREKLLENGAKLYPSILNKEGKFDVIRDIVGRRPARDGGLRLEAETLPGTEKQKNRVVVHAYGAGGRGVELSWGIAEKVLKLVQENLPATQPRSRL